MNKKVLISLIMIGILAFGAGLGTFAWFSSEATSTGGVYESGTLTIGVDTSEEEGYQFDLVSVSKLAPGDVITPITLNIKNTGNLNTAMFKRFSLTAPEGMTPAQAEALSKQILVTQFSVNDWSWNGDVVGSGAWVGNAQFDADNDGLATLYDLTHAAREIGGGWFGLGLKPGESQIITIGLKMNEHAGNDVQGLAAKLGVQVIATQVNDDAIDDVMQNTGLNLSVDYAGDTNTSYFYSHFNRD